MVTKVAIAKSGTSALLVTKRTC